MFNSAYKYHAWEPGPGKETEPSPENPPLQAPEIEPPSPAERPETPSENPVTSPVPEIDPLPVEPFTKPV